jgi:pSer/pThr/pTyr-binding forkhead associated (FHA) protein
LLFLLPKPTIAQKEEEPNAFLSPLNIEEFPLIKAFLTIQDSQGNFLHGITQEELQVIENSIPIPVSKFQQLQPGAQFVITLNPGRSFALRNSRAISRYDFILEALINWAHRRSGSTIDDLSLLVTNGKQASHLNTYPDLMEALAKIDRETAREMEPNLDTLSKAIDLASDPTPRAGMGRSVLFITPPLTTDYALPINDLITRANQNNVQINIWMVASEGTYPPQAAEQLNSLANQTGGKFFMFTGDNQIPNPEIYLDSLRDTYQIEYHSQVKTSGTHQVNVEIQTPKGKITTPPQSFNITIQPPDPAFISPPLEINRQPPMEDKKLGKEEIEPKDYLPTSIELKVVISFPDEHPRRLTRTSLYVDGKVVDENTSPPFETFTWNLSNFSQSAPHTVKVEAEDILGLVGSSIDSTIYISIKVPKASPWSWLYDNITILSIMAIFLSGAILLLVLVLGGRIQPRNLRNRFTRHPRKLDPITQPVSLPPDEESPQSRFPQWINRLHWPQRDNLAKSMAFLTRITDEYQFENATPIPLTSLTTMIGSDPKQATLIIDDPSVEALHASLVQKADGSFYIVDKGSIAGTWVNYMPISKQEIKLEHGDLLNFGRVAFRFTLRNPARVRKPVITPLDPEDIA